MLPGQLRGSVVKGNIIGFDADTNTGAVSGHDGKRYDFVTQDWRGSSHPRHGDVVDFQAEGDRATQIYLVEPEYVQPTLGQFLFSPHGRISRSQYWLKWLVPYLVIYAILFGLTLATQGSVAGGVFGIILFVFAVVMIWPSIAILVKRVHDRDWPWPFILVLLVPFVSIWPMIEIWFLRGTVGANRFGPDPVPRQ
jgi:uncharacterized membrane protein YhaH (DUF805 family)